MKNMKGIFTALLTPFTQREAVNHTVLRQLVNVNLAKGVTGFYVGGSTAEAFLLSLDERKQILETVMDEVAGRAAIIAHVGCIGQSHALDLARHAKCAGVDAISSVPPFYYGFTFNEIKDYYFALADEAEKPVLIYNFPSFSGVKLTTENIRVFLKDSRFMGVKHTSSDFFMLERIKQMREDVVVYNGYDEMFLSGIAAGADGGIGSTYNFMAEKFVEMMRLNSKGRTDEAQALQHQANNIIQALCKAGVFQGEKYALKLMGVDMGPCRKPFLPMDTSQEDMLYKVLLENGCAIEND